jgi:hypothetical protein
MPFRCAYCALEFPKQSSMKKHITLKQDCLAKHTSVLSKFQINVADTSLPSPTSNPGPSAADISDSDSEQLEEMDVDLPPSPQPHYQDSPTSMFTAESLESEGSVSGGDR